MAGIEDETPDAEPCGKADPRSGGAGPVSRVQEQRQDNASRPGSAEPFGDFLRRQGAIGTAIAEKDWSKTSLGPIGNWPAALLATLRMVLTTRQPIVFFWGPDLHQFFNAAYAPILNGMPPDPIGAPFRLYWAEVFEDVRPYFEATMAGSSAGDEDLPLRLTRNGVTEDTYWTFAYSPLYDDEGAIAGFLNIVNESTRAVRSREAFIAATEALAEENRRVQAALAQKEAAEKRQQVLKRELSHRMKNSLAMVQAIVSQSVRHSRSLDEAGQSIIARVQALGRAQDTLTRTSWERTDVAAVVESALAPHRGAIGDARIAAHGPAIPIPAEQGLGLSLAIHELATNAVKYGALSKEDGTVDCRWRRDGERFDFSWTETTGTATTVPERRGFGSRLLERIVPSYFGGSARTEFGACGIAYRLTGTLDADNG